MSRAPWMTWWLVTIRPCRPRPRRSRALRRAASSHAQHAEPRVALVGNDGGGLDMDDRIHRRLRSPNKRGFTAGMAAERGTRPIGDRRREGAGEMVNLTVAGPVATRPMEASMLTTGPAKDPVKVVSRSCGEGLSGSTRTKQRQPPGLVAACQERKALKDYFPWVNPISRSRPPVFPRWAVSSGDSPV